MRRRRALSARIAALALLGGFAGSRAFAHGPPPEALEPLLEERGLPTLVRLSAGLAERRADGTFGFVCPSAWSGSGSDPMAARSDGLLAIATFDGLMLRDQGEFRRHPESADGRALGVASAGDQLYALLERGGQYEVARVERERLEVFWRDAGPWFGIGAAPAFLQLVALEQGTVRELLVPLDGGAPRIAQARIEGDVLTVQARPLRAGPYLVLRSASGVGHSLARFEGEELRTLLMATNTLVGPVENAAGEAWVAVDGKAARFVDERAVPEGGSEFVSRVSCSSASCYATVRAGLAPLGREGAPLVLSLAELAAPDFDRVPIVRRDDCRAEWHDWEFDLVAADLVAPERADGGTEAGVAMDAGLAQLDAGGEPYRTDSSAGWGDASPRKARAEGCSLASERSDSNAFVALLWLVTCACFLARRERSR